MKSPLFRPMFDRKKNPKTKVYPGKLCRINKCSARARDRRLVQPIGRTHLTPFHPVFTKKENPKMKVNPGKWLRINKCSPRACVRTVWAAVVGQGVSMHGLRVWKAKVAAGRSPQLSGCGNASVGTGD
jgi:hypothetical protein